MLLKKTARIKCTMNQNGTLTFFFDSARVRREDELPVHLASAQHQC
jgi:hypothetical protein